MSGLCNMAFEHLLNSRLICFYATDLIHMWRSQVVEAAHCNESLLMGPVNSSYTPRMAYVRQALHRILSFRIQNVVAAWRDEMARALCDYPCTCMCGSQAAANTLPLANAQLAAARDNLRLHDEAEAQVPSQPANSTSPSHGCLDHDTAHAFHTLLVETPTVYLTSASSSCGDKGPSFYVVVVSATPAARCLGASMKSPVFAV